MGPMHRACIHIASCQSKTVLEYALSARCPRKIVGGQCGDAGRRYRTLGRPAPARRNAEALGVSNARALQLRLDAFAASWILLARGKRRFRTRFPRSTKIDQEGQDRVRIRRCAELDASAFSQRAVARANAGDELANHREHRRPVLISKPARFFDERLDARVLAPRRFAEPNKVIPDQRVREILRRWRCTAPSGSFGYVEQPLVRWEAPHHTLVVGAAQRIAQMAQVFLGLGASALQSSQ